MGTSISKQYAENEKLDAKDAICGIENPICRICTPHFTLTDEESRFPSHGWCPDHSLAADRRLGA
jgi:hypothetical protein